MKSFLLSVVLLFSFFSNLQGKDLDINKIVQKAQAQNKQVMFFFHIPFCPYCDRMLKKNFKDKELLSLVEKNFVFEDIYTKDKGVVSFNGFKGTRKEFAKHIGAVAYPATVFLDVNGKVVHKAIGYRNIQEHLVEIKYVATKSYVKKDLETFAMDLEIGEEDDE